MTDIIQIDDDRVLEWARASWDAFGDRGAKDETMRAVTAHIDADRRWGVEDRRGHLIATCGAFGTELTVPGGGSVPCAAVAIVAVLPTHRRRGIATDVVSHQLRDTRERGEVLAILEASEGAIYGRYGYGAAAWRMEGRVQRGRSAFLAPLVDRGAVELLTLDEARATLPPLYDRLRRRTPGEVHRTERLWDGLFADPEEERHGGGPRIDAVHVGADNEPDGFLTYRISSKWEGAMSESSLLVEEVHAATPEVYATLWRFALDVDLMAEVRCDHIVPDEPLRWLLQDPRQLRVSVFADGQWVRILDVGAALAGREYLAADDLVVELADPIFDDVSGAYRIVVEDGRAEVERTDAAADVRLGITELGALYLGGGSASSLARARRIEPLTAGIVPRLDALFTGEVYPCNHTWY